MEEESRNTKPTEEDMLHMTTEMVSAYVSNNILPAGQISEVIKTVYASLSEIAGVGSGAAETLKPAVPIRRSVTPDFIVCLEDGKKLKMLKRHLRTNYSLSPEEYRSKWGLPSDYPMVAPNYAAQRSEFAKRIGLGRKSRGRPPAAAN